MMLTKSDLDGHRMKRNHSPALPCVPEWQCGTREHIRTQDSQLWIFNSVPTLKVSSLSDEIVHGIQFMPHNAVAQFAGALDFAVHVEPATGQPRL